MKKEALVIAAVLSACAWSVSLEGRSPARSDTSQAGEAERGALDAGGESAAGFLVGVWTAPAYEVRLSGDLDVSLWGPGASSRRTVDLKVAPSGEATLTVRRAVVDARGRTKPGSESIEEARIRVALPDQPSEGRIEAVVKVVSAERRYSENPDYRWPLDDLTVKVSTVASDADRINVRFDTADGRASFGESLIRKRS